MVFGLSIISSIAATTLTLEKSPESNILGKLKVRSLLFFT